MSDSTKLRLAIDLDAIENQLMSTRSQPSPNQFRNDDPLSELARIVGQDDPFRSLLSKERPKRPASEAIAMSRSDRDEPRRQEPQAIAPRAASPARPSQPIFDAAPSRETSDRHPGAHEAYRTTMAETQGDQPGDYDEYAYAEEGEGADQEGYADAPTEPAPPAAAVLRSRKGVIAVGAVMGIAVIGVAAAFGLRDTGASTISGEPPIIRADNAPTKIQPQNPGGADVPNQNNQIYEQAAAQPKPQQTKIVDRSEQPVDVNQAARRDMARLSAGAAETTQVAAPQPPQAANPTLALGEPKRVKTVAVKPDGSVLADVVPSSAPETAAITTTPKPAATTPAQDAQTRPARVVEARSSVSETAAAPLSINSLAERRHPAPPRRQVAAAPPADDIPSPASTASTAPSGGGYVVQLGAPPSEKDARDLFETLQRKHASDLGSLEPIVVKAETSGRTIYRLRVGSLSRADATSLCTRLQAAGGACFVSKN